MLTDKLCLRLFPFHVAGTVGRPYHEGISGRGLNVDNGVCACQAGLYLFPWIAFLRDME